MSTTTTPRERVKRYTPDETEDYYRDADDVPPQTKRFCFTHGYSECGAEAIDCDVIEEREAA